MVNGSSTNPPTAPDTAMTAVRSPVSCRARFHPACTAAAPSVSATAVRSTVPCSAHGGGPQLGRQAPEDGRRVVAHGVVVEDGHPARTPRHRVDAEAWGVAAPLVVVGHRPVVVAGDREPGGAGAADLLEMKGEVVGTAHAVGPHLLLALERPAVT